MGFWWFFNFTLLAAGAVSLALSIVWRRPDLLMNLVLNDMDLKRTPPAPLPTPPSLLTFVAIMISWPWSRYYVPDNMGHIYRRRNPKKPPQRGIILPELGSYRQHALCSRPWYLDLGFHFARTGQLPQSLFGASSRHSDCLSRYGAL
jgi:hypothetical protein